MRLRYSPWNNVPCWKNRNLWSIELPEIGVSELTEFRAEFLLDLQREHHCFEWVYYIGEVGEGIGNSLGLFDHQVSEREVQALGIGGATAQKSNWGTDGHFVGLDCEGN